MFQVRLRHVIGTLVGALAGIIAASLAKPLGYNLAHDDGLFWGGVVGGVLSGVPDFARSGAVLTGRQNRTLNSLVGLVGGLILLGAAAAIVILVLGLIF